MIVRAARLFGGDRYSYLLSRSSALRPCRQRSERVVNLVPCGVIFDVSIVPILYTESYYKYASELFEDQMGYKKDL